jgi:hypothetical protein
VWCPGSSGVSTVSWRLIEPDPRATDEDLEWAASKLNAETFPRQLEHC